MLDRTLEEGGVVPDQDQSNATADWDGEKRFKDGKSRIEFNKSSIVEQPQSQLPLPLPMEDRSWHFMVAFVGPSQVGKTKLIRRFTDSQFSVDYVETTSASSRSKAVNIGRQHVTFQCWDTAGQSTLGRGLDTQLRFLHALFIVFDASRDCSGELEGWFRLAHNCSPPHPMLVLVGNKTDLGLHSGTLLKARQLAESSQAPVFCLSVLADDENFEVDAMMLEVGKELTERHSKPLTVVANSAKAPGATGLSLGPASESVEAAAGGDAPKLASLKEKIKEALDQWPSCCQMFACC